MPIESLLKNLTSSPSAKGALSGAASGALVSALMGTKSGRKLGKTAVKVGGAAAVAGLGYYAFKKWQESRSSQTQSPSVQTQEPSSAPAEQSPLSLDQAATQVEVTETLCAKIILAMIAAAAADGSIDDQEMDTLFNTMESSQLSAGASGQLTAALNEPPTLEEVATLPSNAEEASELYAASLAAIDLDTPAEHLYLRRLAKALVLDSELVQSIHSTAS